MSLPISGHAAGPIRTAFLDSVEAGAPDSAMAGKLWNCTDIVPAVYCAEMDLAPGATFGQAARALLKR